MYTIKQAAIRTGVSVELLRAWERRYGVPAPGRTGSGYRLYGDADLAQIRLMRSLVESGWPPSQAAGEAASGRPIAASERAVTPAGGVPSPSANGGLPTTTPGDMSETAVGANGAALPPGSAGDRLNLLRLQFVGAARALDERGLERALSEALVMLGTDDALEQFVLPAVAAIGRGWSEGELTVASEHAASGVVMRRLAAMYEAASTATGSVECVIGLPPGARHEIGAFAFAVTCKRAGLGVLYLGPDVPEDSWLAAAAEHPAAALVVGAVTPVEAAAAARVIAALKSSHPDRIVAVGGGAGPDAAAGRSDVLLLPNQLQAAAGVLVAGIVGHGRLRG